jgi:hypothetical protein
LFQLIPLSEHKEVRALIVLNSELKNDLPRNLAMVSFHLINYLESIKPTQIKSALQTISSHLSSKDLPAVFDKLITVSRSGTVYLELLKYSYASSTLNHIFEHLNSDQFKNFLSKKLRAEDLNYVLELLRATKHQLSFLEKREFQQKLDRLREEIRGHLQSLSANDRHNIIRSNMLLLLDVFGEQSKNTWLELFDKNLQHSAGALSLESSGGPKGALSEAKAPGGLSTCEETLKK